MNNQRERQPDARDKKKRPPGRPFGGEQYKKPVRMGFQQISEMTKQAEDTLDNSRPENCENCYPDE